MAGCTEEYIPLLWANERAPAINASNLNHIEQGLKKVTDGCIEASAQLEKVGVPLGGIIMWSGRVVPAGWVICDGTNGTPNLVDRFIRGSTADLTTVGDTGGKLESTLPAHTHTANHSHTASMGHAGAHTHRIWHQQGADGCCANPSICSRASGKHAWMDSAGDHTHSLSINTASVTTSSTGSNDPEGNLPPYYTLAFIMRIE
jgi:microcystin-dependent protein